MFSTDEKVELNFLIDDLKDLMVRHKHLAELGIRLKNELLGQPRVVEVLSHVINVHHQHIADLRALIERYSTGPDAPQTRERPLDVAALQATLALHIPGALSDLINREGALILEYVRGINSFAKVEGLEPVLRTHEYQLRQVVSGVSDLLDKQSAEAH